MSATADLSAALAAVVSDEIGAPVAIEGLRRMSGGASRETWSFDARPATDIGPPLPLVVQRERAGGAREGSGMGVEARLLRAAAAAGVPVAPLLVADGDEGRSRADLGGPWLVAERIEGETIPRKLLRDDEWTDARSVLASQCGAALAAIHRIPLADVPGLDPVDQLERYRVMYDDLGQPHPTFELALRWLDEHRAPPAEQVVVHGDFRNGNLMVGPEGLRAVLDWELAHVGDPAEDLAWLCLRAWRFGSPLPVGGFGERADLLAAYAEAGGPPIDPAALRWWEVLGTFKWGVICIVQTSIHLSGMSRSVELAAIGRRVCETEHDLLALLPGAPAGTAREPVPAASCGPSLHDVPTAGELLEAVREYLAGDVVEATEGRVRFHARVAAKVLGMVERELMAGPGQAAAHAHRLATLGVDDGAALASAIRRGALDHRVDEVRAVVAADVADKLAVANPGYADEA